MENKSWVLEVDLPEPYLLINQLYRGPFAKEAHSHPFWQIILVTGGQLQITAGEHSNILRAGNVHILPPGWEHALSSPEGYSQLGIDLDGDCFVRDLAPLLSRHFLQPADFPAEQLLPLAAQISEEQQKGTPFAAARMINLADTLVLGCLEAAESDAGLFEEQLSAYLDANLHRQLYLQEIADQFFISVPHLERLCRRSYQCGVMALLKQRRFRKAQQLLILTELSVGEIGALVGYPDPAHFSGFFRNCSGVSPRTYRAQKRLYA